MLRKIIINNSIDYIIDQGIFIHVNFCVKQLKGLDVKSYLHIITNQELKRCICHYSVIGLNSMTKAIAERFILLNSPSAIKLECYIVSSETSDHEYAESKFC